MVYEIDNLEGQQGGAVYIVEVLTLILSIRTLILRTGE
jgi:hypothetical protein